MSEPQRSSLTVLGGPLNGTRVVLEDVDQILIGSDPDCKLCVDLPGVSPIHARFWQDLSGAKVYDTRSATGLYVNDDLITAEGPVRDGDVLWLGEPGAAESVMIQVRLVPPAASAHGFPAEGDQGEFFLEDAPRTPDSDLPPIPIAAADDFVFEPETPGGPPPPAPDPPSAPEEVLLFDELPAASPPGVAPSEAEFLIEDVEPPGPLPPPASPPRLPPAPPPLVKAPPAPAPQPAAPAVAPSPPAPPPAPKPVARVAAPPSAPAAPPASADVFVVDDAAIKGAQPVAPAPRAAPAPRPTAAPGMPPAPRPAAAPRPAPKRSSGGIGRLVPIAIGALLLLGAGGYAAMYFMSAPELSGVSPARAGVGDSVMITGRNFSANPAENQVMFSGRAGRVVAASTTQLKVELPALTTTAGKDVSVDVAVSVKGRSTKPGTLAVFQAPRLHAISPDIGMPSDVVALAGTAWGATPKVLFDAAPAEVVELAPASMKVRVPALEGAPGTEVKVTVSTAADTSNALVFALGRLPLVNGVKPASAAPGDVVSITGRGFHERGGNDVRIGGIRALVVAVEPATLKVAVPFLPSGGPQPVEVRVPGSDHVGQASLTAADPPEAVALHFAAEPVGEDRSQAAVSTVLGPAFLLASASGRSAAERAADAAQRLNEALPAIRASRDTDFVARGFDRKPMLALAGKDEPLLEATGADAALYDQRGGGKEPISPARLAVWWEAVAGDLVLLLVRGEKPQRVAALSAADGRPLADLFAAVQKAGGQGVSRTVLSSAKPPLLASLRSFAVRLPASVPTPAAAAGPAAVAVDPAGVPALPTDRVWSGFEVVDGIRKYATLTLKGGGGKYAYSGGVAVSVPVSGVEQKRGELRFALQTGGRSRYYLGKWDGTRVAGRISSDTSGSGDVGSFELMPR